MYSALPDNDYVGPKNASKVYDDKQASFTYLSDSSVSMSSTSSQLEMLKFSKDESIICSIFSLFFAHFLPQKFFKSLISSFRHVLILLMKSAAPSEPVQIEKESVRQTLDPILEGICSIGLDCLQKRETEPVRETGSRRGQAVSALKWWPLSSSIIKIVEEPLLLKQIYYVLIDDVVCILFPEIRNWNFS